MNLESITFLISFLIPIGLFVFARKILDKEKYRTYFLISLSLLALTGILLTVLINQINNFSSLLVVPIISYLIYILSAKEFKRKFKRFPIDTTMDWRDGLKWDRLFNIGYIMLGILLPFGIMIVILTI